MKKEEAIERMKASGFQSMEGGFQMNEKPLKVPKRFLFRGLAHNVECTSVTYNDGGSLIVTGGSDVYLKVWDSSTSAEKFTLRGLAHSVMDVSICAGSELIMAGSTDNIAYIWNYNTGRIKHNLTGHANKICSTLFFNNQNDAVIGSVQFTLCAISGSGNYIACSSKDDSITIMDIRNFRKVCGLTHHNYVCAGNFSKICWSSDSNYVAAGEQRGQIFVWNAGLGKIEEVLDRGHSTAVVAVAWRPRESNMASVDAVGGMVI